MKTARGLAVMLLLLSLTACTTVLPARREAVYQVAVESSLEDEPILSARASWAYLQESNQDDPRYDRAQRLLALSAQKLGLHWAASLWWLDIVQARRDVTLLEEATGQLARLSTRGDWDEHTLLEGFLATGDVSGLQGEARNFVLYQQGLDSLRRDMTPWAERSFAEIDPGSPWEARARYAMLVRALAQGDAPGAQEGLEALLARDGLAEDLKEEVQRALARLAFAQGRYEEALTRFVALRDRAPDDASLLLELAWTYYRLHQPQRALGLLVALDAPVHRDFIAPERFLLEALSLQKLCQFEPARRAAVRLRVRHGDALAEVLSGTPLRETEALKAAARRRVGSLGAASLRASVVKEAALVEALYGDLEPALGDFLRDLYRRGLVEAERREQEVLRADLESLAGELLRAREGVQLIQHEISVGLLRGRRKSAAQGSGEVLRAQEEPQVLYLFDGEFWTDELDDIVVKMEDRCIE